MVSKCLPVHQFVEERWWTPLLPLFPSSCGRRAVLVLLTSSSLRAPVSPARNLAPIEGLGELLWNFFVSRLQCRLNAALLSEPTLLKSTVSSALPFFLPTREGIIKITNRYKLDAGDSMMISSFYRTIVPRVIEVGCGHLKTVVGAARMVL